MDKNIVEYINTIECMMKLLEEELGRTCDYGPLKYRDIRYGRINNYRKIINECLMKIDNYYHYNSSKRAEKLEEVD